jgi:hypothetical protein
MATDETRKNRGIVRYGDLYLGVVENMKGSGFVRKYQSEISETFVSRRR